MRVVCQEAFGRLHHIGADFLNADIQIERLRDLVHAWRPFFKTVFVAGKASREEPLVVETKNEFLDTGLFGDVVRALVEQFAPQLVACLPVEMDGIGKERVGIQQAKDVVDVLVKPLDIPLPDLVDGRVGQFAKRIRKSKCEEKGAEITFAIKQKLNLVQKLGYSVNLNVVFHTVGAADKKLDRFHYDIPISLLLSITLL